MRLESRVKKLEALASGRGPCGTCGFDGDWSNVEIVTRVSLIGEASAGPTEPDEVPRRCAGSRIPHLIRVLGEKLDFQGGGGRS